MDPVVEEYEAGVPDGVQVPVKDDSLENSGMVINFHVSKPMKKHLRFKGGRIIMKL